MFPFTVLVCISLLSYGQGSARYPAKSIWRGSAPSCYPIWFDNYVSAGYALHNNQITIKAHNNIIPFRHKTYGDLEWRLPHNENSYFDLRLYHEIKGRYHRPHQFYLFGAYKRIKSNNLKVAEQFFIGSHLRLNTKADLSFTAALAQQNRQHHEGQTTSHQGISIGISTEHWDQFTINASTTCWFNQWQHALRLRQYIRSRSLFIGVGWEKVNEWREVDLEVGVRI